MNLKLIFISKRLVLGREAGSLRLPFVLSMHDSPPLISGDWHPIQIGCPPVSLVEPRVEVRRPGLRARPQRGPGGCDELQDHFQFSASGQSFGDALGGLAPARRLDLAVNDLKQKRPELSAGVPVRGWQIGFVIGFAVLAAASWVV